MFKRIPLFAALLCAMLIISCQKEVNIDLGTGGAANVSGVLKMKINGTQWVASREVSASMLVGLININGISADGKALSLTLNDSVPGTYVLDQTSFHVAALSDSTDFGGLSYTTNEGSDSSDAGGVVIVTSVDKVKKTLSGTFHFKMFRDYDNKQKVITEGVFDKLTYSVTLPAARLTDTFRVKIDNVDWTGRSITGVSSGTDIFINASELDLSKIVGLSFPSSITPGTYNLDALAGSYIGLYAPNPVSFLSSQSGKLTIIEHNRVTKRVRGNFDFKAVELGGTKTAQLSVGYFSLVYQ